MDYSLSLNSLITDDVQVIARGPAVVGGEASLGVTGKIREDHTLLLL